MDAKTLRELTVLQRRVEKLQKGIANASGRFRALIREAEQIANVQSALIAQALTGSEPSDDTPVSEAVLQEEIALLELTVRTKNCLQAASISTLGELRQKTPNDLLALPSFNRKQLDEVVTLLASRNLRLSENKPLVKRRKVT